MKAVLLSRTHLNATFGINDLDGIYIYLFSLSLSTDWRNYVCRNDTLITAGSIIKL